MKSKSKSTGSVDITPPSKEYLIRNTLPTYFVVPSEGLEYFHKFIEKMTPLTNTGYGRAANYTIQLTSDYNNYAIEHMGPITEAIYLSQLMLKPFHEALDLAREKQFNERCRGIKAYKSVQHANDETATEHTEVA